MVKDTERAGPDGQTAGQRGRKCFKIYRREEQRIKSRGRRGVSKLDSLEMLPQRGREHLLVFPSLETQETGEEETNRKRERGGSLIVKPKANLKSKTTPASQNLILWLSDTAHPSLYLLVLMAQHPRGKIYGSPSLALPGLPSPNSCAMARRVLQVLT